MGSKQPALDSPVGGGRRGSLRLPGLRAGTEQAPTATDDFEDEGRPDDETVEGIYATAEQSRLKEGSSLLRDVLDISNVLTDGAAAMVDDSFLRCFTSRPQEPWNWNFYLFPCWCLGVVVRFCILFPLRLICILVSNCTIVILLTLVYLFIRKGTKLRVTLERKLAQAMCWAFLMSWSAVIKFHGPRPVAAPNRVWVANHTSMIDYAVVNISHPFAVIMQLQGGWVRFVQTYVMGALGMWFNRTDLKDRLVVAQRMKDHVSQPGNIPLLIFPEGTCVNNEYTVLFKRGAFDMGCTVCPIAIKYNKVFVDAFWNSKKLPFTKYLLRIMSSWALVCDVWFLEPQTQLPGESADEFAARVQRMIADKAKLRIVPWDGYLKYYNLGQKNPGLIEKRRKVFADNIKKHLGRGTSREQGVDHQDQGKSQAQAAVTDKSNRVMDNLRKGLGP